MNIRYRKEDTYLYIGLLALLACYVWAFWPTISELVGIWTRNDDYSHGFIIIPVVVYLIARKRPVPEVNASTAKIFGLLMVIGSLIASLLGLLSEFRTLANVAVVLAIWGVLIYLVGLEFVLIHRWELFLLAFMLPIPSNIYAEITLPLQLIVTKVVNSILGMVDIPVYREGNILHLPDASLEVINACSGLRSILSIIVLAYVMSCLVLTSGIQRMIMIATAIPLAIVTNLIRVTTMAISSYHGKDIFVDGAGHTAMGLALFGINIFCLVGLGKFIPWAFSRE